MQPSDLIGLSLDDALRSLKGTDRTLFIGSQSAFVYIGTQKEVEKHIDGVSKKWVGIFADRCKRSIEEMAASIRSTPQDKKRTTAFADTVINSIQTLREFKRMRDRKVINAYYKEKDYGIALIIEGAEQGRYWTKAEWDKRKEKRDEDTERGCD